MQSAVERTASVTPTGQARKSAYNSWAWGRRDDATAQGRRWPASQRIASLVDHESAKQLEILGRAVASKKLPAQEGRTAIGAVGVARAHVGEAEMKLFDELREDVERLKQMVALKNRIPKGFERM